MTNFRLGQADLTPPTTDESFSFIFPGKNVTIE